MASGYKSSSDISQISVYILVNVCRLLVAATFVLSGLVKLIDPTGTAYKIQDYFMALGLGTSATSLLPTVLAVVLAMVEFCLGIYLLFGIRRRVTTFLLLVFTLIYTPLTLWLAVTDAVADCGCFGDAIRLTNWQTFWKNAVLLLMSFIIWWRGNLLTRFISESVAWIISLFSILYGLFIAGIGLTAEPVIDFRPYHIGQHIPTAMQWPEDPTKTPEILDFDIQPIPGQPVPPDIEELLADTSYSFLLVSPHLETADDSDFELINSASDYARHYGYRFLALTASAPEAILRWQDLTGAEYPFAFTDELTLKTMARRNPALILLHDGTIVAKWPTRFIPDDTQLTAPLHALSLAHPQPENHRRAILNLGLWYILPLLLLTLIDRFIFSLRWWRRRHTPAASILLAVILMAGCRHRSQMDMLVEAESFLPAEPDSADARLKTVDVQHLKGDETESAYYALLRTMTDAMSEAAPLNDTLVQRAYTFYRQKSNHGASSDHSLVRHYAQSALYMGDWYAANDSVKASEDCYRKAIKYSEKAEDWHTCYIAYSCLAEQIHSGNPVAAFSLIENAIKIYELCNDNIRNLISLYSYATHYLFQIAYMDDTTYQQALIFAYKAYNIARDSCFTDYYDSTNMLLAEIYWGMGECQKALEYVKNIHPEDLESEASLTTNMKIAQFYLSCDSILKAKELYESPKVISDKTLTYLYARGLAEVAAHQLIKDSILFYMDSAFTASEAMFLDALQAKDEYYHDNLEKEKENERLIYKSKLKTWIFGSSIFIILIGGLLIGRVLILRIRVHRERRRNSIMQRKYDLERNLEEKRRAESQMRLLQERQQALEESQQKKMATIKHLQRYIIDRTDVTMKLKDDTTHVKMSSKEWIDIELLLDEIDDRRISKIRARFKELSTEDIRLCIMVRIGMSNPAIGNVYGITPSAVQHRKLTLKKKGFGVDNPDVTLDDFIESI